MPQDLPPQDQHDPHLWLEEVQGEAALAWVRERNAHSLAQLQADPRYARLRHELLEVLNASDRIPAVTRRGDWFYNLWQDEQHKRGLWRRCTLDEYRRPEPAWETVLDLDALGAAEGESWVFAGAQALAPEYRRCLVSLSRGGADAHVLREFDLVEKRFIPAAEGGFELAEAKSQIEWIDADSVYVGTDFGPGSLTDSGYVRVLKRWRRGTPLSAAETVFEGETQDVAVSVMVDRRPGFERTIFSRALDFYRQASFLLQSDGRLARLTLPDDAQPHFWGPRLLISLRSDWEIAGQTFAAGSLLLADAAAFLAGARDFTPLFTPTPTRSLADYTLTREHLILNISDKVASRLEEWDFRSEPPRLRPVQAPFPGTLSIVGLHDDELVEDALAERYLLSYTDFLTPDTLSLAQAGTDAREPLKARLPQFDASGMRAEQFFAQSADGTAVPYFVIWPAGARPDGANPTLLYGYGGFEVSMQPWYSGGFGRAWYSGGGVLVLANIRGGGEFGPAWHQAAILDKKQRSYDDFIAVAEDLIARGITRPRQLGIMGGSNGGLLVGAVTMQRPELFHAVVCQVPLLDMRRYHQLLAGASWMAEYGNPDEAADWASIARYSPYQNVAADRHYPKMLFTTSTRDDRVHPGHARKMAARMLAQGHEILYYENIEGGHGGAADNEQRATLQALEYSYLWQQLARPAAQALGQSRIAAERGGLPVAAQQVLSFWFGPPGGPDEGQPRAAWFSKDPAFDAEIRERFGALIEQALEGGLRDWDAHGASGALARILLLDQFTRNSLRDTARAFAGDALALRAALTLLDAGGDRALTTLQRVFAYLPLEHAEDLALQHRSVALFEALAAEDAQRADALDYARRHLAVIERFGRFPHRNAALGRTSTPEELDYLAQPGAGF